MIPKEQSTQQCSTVVYSICEQNPSHCRNPLQQHRNIEREALSILHGLEKFHHYCFTHEVSVKTDHKQLVAIFKKDVLRLQRILLHIIQYNIGILHKCEPQLFIAKWPSRHNHETNRDKEIPSLCITINARVMHGKLDCMTVDELKPMLDDEYSGILSEYVLLKCRNLYNHTGHSEMRLQSLVE